MPDEGASPSAGWRAVYRAMGADPNGTDDRLRADGGGSVKRGRAADPERCPDCRALLGTGSGDLCCDAYAERLRAADGPD